MWKLSLKASPYTPEISKFVKDTRISLKSRCEKEYSIRAVSEKIGCSTAQYQRLEKGTRELTNIKHVYGIARTLNIPMDQLIQMYFGMSDKERLAHFTLTDDYKDKFSNGIILKEARACFDKFHSVRSMGDISSVSATHYCRVENGVDSFKDIRFMLDVANTLNIPMYVLIRNELKITDDDLMQVVSIYSGEN